MSFNPSDLHTDNLDAANADWEDYAEYLGRDDAEEFERNQLALDNEYDPNEYSYTYDDEFEVEDEAEADMYGMEYDAYFGEDEYGF